jgi:hypothetical protein
MRTVFLLLALLLPVSAFAQAGAPPGDVAYCNRLADLYDRYLGQSDNSPWRSTIANSLDGQVASTQCREGKPASAIPTLERLLRGNGFTLPPRN